MSSSNRAELLVVRAASSSSLDGPESIPDEWREAYAHSGGPLAIVHSTVRRSVAWPSSPESRIEARGSLLCRLEGGPRPYSLGAHMRAREGATGGLETAAPPSAHVRPTAERGRRTAQRLARLRPSPLSRPSHPVLTGLDGARQSTEMSAGSLLAG
jgi:hypothetical protein